jgi:MOSC domain-containing protein YiiM
MVETRLQTAAPLRSGVVLALSMDPAHCFSKPNTRRALFVKDHGIVGDAHAGQKVQHRHLANRDAQLPNLRQVHLVQSELFAELERLGFAVGPGQLGENITTTGIDLLDLPLGTRLGIGADVVLELTGLRIPCGYIDRFQKGLKRTLIQRTPAGASFRAGVFAIVKHGGAAAPGDIIRVNVPCGTSRPLPAM